MAVTANHRAKGTRLKDPRVNGPTTNEKDNVSPQKAKKQKKRKEVHNINAIFDQAERESKSKYRESPRDVLSPKFTGVKKATLGKFGAFSRVKQKAEMGARNRSVSTPDVEALHDFAKQKKGLPPSFGIAETLEPYIQESTSAWARKMEDSRKQLDAARNGVDPATGRSLNKSGVPSREDFDALAQEIEETNRPFEDGHLMMRFKNPDDPATPVIKEIRIGDITDRFFKRCAQHKVKQKQLDEEHEAIEQELAQLKQEILDDAAKAAKDMEKHTRALEEEVAAIEADAKAERAELKEQQKKNTALLNKKIQELVDMF
ncbi:hypothetical protein CKM354_000767300 [Cercospora kikuchii]|uniref:Uncharacterized protein n=1 Tax=Cercospora kikuchii TaxID=84275 RepID=A0A9P3FEJ1_9PEZI|nr:uncharacterized protein CKM354_000767300 [Cercospora kikuchii]GIZ44476.1 hypothetical protein CKM354_000767300 [Cercospora kikuchii]